MTDPAATQAQAGQPDVPRRARPGKAAAAASASVKPKAETTRKAKTVPKAEPLCRPKTASKPKTASLRKKAPATPAGRPKGSRGRLGEAFLAALQADFLEHGPQTIAALRDKAPATYVNTVAGLMPKDVKISDERDLSDDELLERIRQLDAVIASLLRPEGPETPDGSA